MTLPFIAEYCSDDAADVGDVADVAGDNSTLQSDHTAPTLNTRAHLILRYFDDLPDDALVDFKIASIVMYRSPSSLWRDVAAKRLPAPILIGKRSARMRVGDLRSAIKGRTMP